MKNIMKKINKSRKFILVVLVLFASLFISVGIVSFSPFPVQDTSISATDFVKNFEFVSIDSEPIVNEGAYGNKLRFDTQSAWVLYPSDVYKVYTLEDKGTTYIRYRVNVRNRINMFTNFRLNQFSQYMYEVEDKPLAGTYRHNGLGGSTSYRWEEYITWKRWEFGDVRNYALNNLVFSGRVKMSFDIDPNPIPDSIGSGTNTLFDYIAVSDAGIVTNIHGKLSQNMPTIVTISPSEYKSSDLDTISSGKESVEGTAIKFANDGYAYKFDPDISITDSAIINAIDGSILPDTPGSSLNPKNKDGSAIYNPENEQSMTGANLYYDINSLSPIVYEYGATLSWNRIYLETENYLGAWFTIDVNQNKFTSSRQTRSKSTALHGINRYIQTEMYVSFDIWTSLDLGVLKEDYELKRLHTPEEYYDELIWSTIVGGWSGSLQVTSPPQTPMNAVEDFFNSIGEFFRGLFDLDKISGVINSIIVVVILFVSLYIFIKIGIPYLRSRQRRKEIKTIMRRSKRN